METQQEQQNINRFSLSTGGLFYSLSQRAGLAHRTVTRALILTALAWIPLFVISYVTAYAGLNITFLRDYGVYGRILVAIPVLVIAEIPIGRRTGDVLQQFVNTNLTRQQEAPTLSSAIRDATKQKNSIMAEIIILALIYSNLAVRRDVVIASDPLNIWYFTGERISPAGWYFILISLPIFQFLLLRWIWRLAIWTGLLFRISRLNLQLMPTHPDRMGGLGFLGLALIPFGMVGFACGAVVSTYLMNNMAYKGLSLTSSANIMVVFIFFAVLILIIPILVFTDKLIALRANGILKYGNLGEDYVRMFDRKWIEGSDEDILGTSDIQSLADLANSFDIVQNMRTIAADTKTIMVIAAMAAIPMIPVFFAALPFDEIIIRLLGMFG